MRRLNTPCLKQVWPTQPGLRWGREQIRMNVWVDERPTLEFHQFSVLIFFSPLTFSICTKQTPKPEWLPSTFVDIFPSRPIHFQCSSELNMSVPTEWRPKYLSWFRGFRGSPGRPPVSCTLWCPLKSEWHSHNIIIFLPEWQWLSRWWCLPRFSDFTSAVMRKENLNSQSELIPN